MDHLYSLRKLHGHIHEFFLQKKKMRSEYKLFIRPIKHQLKGSPNIAILTLTPEHGNMGDQAIAYSEQQFLTKMNLPYIEISGRILDIVIRNRACNIFNGHPIILNGGGYLGTIWFSAEKCVRTLIQENPDSCIIMLPNTFYYEDSEFGKSELEKSTKIYNNHKNLHIFAREKISYNQMQLLYRNVSLAPDMVLSLNETYPPTNRHGCLLCLRSDKEKTRTDEDDIIISEQAVQIFGANIRRTDMIEGEFVPIADRESALKRKFAEFKNAELVITDRLHGMIFCAITGTPCIAIESKSHKLRGCYNDWLKDIPYIHLITNPSDIVKVYQSIDNTQREFLHASLSSEFDNLSSQILSILQSGV